MPSNVIFTSGSIKSFYATAQSLGVENYQGGAKNYQSGAIHSYGATPCYGNTKKMELCLVMEILYQMCRDMPRYGDIIPKDTSSEWMECS